MILVRLMGGMGNQMFQYAFGFYLSSVNKTELKLDLTLVLDRNSKNEHAVYRNYNLDQFAVSTKHAHAGEINRFNTDPALPLFKKAFLKIRKIFSSSITLIQDAHIYNPKHLNANDNTCIVGRWQSERYFEPVKQELKKQFQFKNALSEKNKIIAGKICEGNSVAIHVRRGDYVTNGLYALGIGALNKKYYEDAIQLIKSRVAEPFFYIFSEDVEWCKKNIHVENCTFVIQDDAIHSSEYDLHLMSLCKHQIISNSTFAWWGAWLSEKENSIIVAPGNWARSNEYIPPFIVPDRWQKIDNYFE